MSIAPPPPPPPSTPPVRPWWKKKQYLIPIGAVVLIGVVGNLAHPNDVSGSSTTPQVVDGPVTGTDDQSSDTSAWTQASDGSITVPINATYVIHVDPDRSVQIHIEGKFRAYASVEDAPAGQTEVFTQASGNVTSTNLSPDRNLDGFSYKHALTAYLPAEACNLMRSSYGYDFSVAEGALCPVEVFTLKDDIYPDAGKANENDDFGTISGSWFHTTVTNQVGTYDENDTETILNDFKQAVLVAGYDGPSISDDIARLNPTCSYPGNNYGDSNYVPVLTYWSQDPEVSECSDFPGWTTNPAGTGTWGFEGISTPSPSPRAALG